MNRIFDNIQSPSCLAIINIRSSVIISMNFDGAAVSGVEFVE